MLRGVEPEDLSYLYQWENYQPLWGVSGTLTPFSKHTLLAFIESQREDIYTSRQLRQMIEVDGVVVGMVDLFEYEPHHQRAGVGIFIAPEFQGLGYGSLAVQRVCEYAVNILIVRSLWASCTVDNEASVALFSSCGFAEVGVRKSWVRVDAHTFKDEVLFQKLL